MRGRLRALPLADQRRLGLGLIGLLSLSSAGVSSLFVREHAALCGLGVSEHCGWCVLTTAFALVGASALGLAAALEGRA